MGHVTHRTISNADVMIGVTVVILELLLFFNDNTAIPLCKSLYLHNGHKRGKKKTPQKDDDLYEYPTEAWTHSILVASVLPHSD